MLLQNSSLSGKKTGACRRFFVLTVIFAVLCAGSQFSFFSEASGLVANLGKLNFLYLDDGSIKIELVSDVAVTNYQIKTTANKTLIQIKGARSTLYPSYLVRNSFDVEVQTTAKEFDGEPGVELTIIAPRGATAVPIMELNKLYFWVSLNSGSTPPNSPLIKTKNTPDNNSPPIFVINLGKINFHYPDDGSLQIELVSDKTLSNYQIKTIGNKAVVQIKGARSTLYPSYLVRNSFEVEVQTTAKEFDGEPGVELAIIIPRNAVVVPTNELNKTYFLVSANAESKIRNPLPDKAKSMAVANIQPISKSPEISFVPQKNETVSPVQSQQGNGIISGQVKDELGGVIVDADVVVTDKDGKQRSVRTNQDGIYRFTNLAPGKYTLKVNAPNFAQYESKEIEITGKPMAGINIALSVKILEAPIVTIEREAVLSSDLENNANGIVLRGEDLNSLPDDPQGLAMALQGLSAAAGSPLAGEVIVDGFAGSRIPPKNAIREIRINKNPYSAEFSRPGNGRIEILTKPGMETFNGGGYFGFNNNWLNTRDPFAATTLPYQSNNYGFYLGGLLKPKRASFFFNFEKGKTDSNNLVNAKILDSNLDIIPVNSYISSPQRYINFTPRIDVKLDDRNTLIGRYSYSKSSTENSGVGGFSLLSRAFSTSNVEHSLQFTETFVINPTTVNEIRSQVVHRVNSRESGNFGLSIDVPGAFTSGASFRRSFNEYKRADASNVVTHSFANHTIRAGAGIRYVSITDFSSQGFGGTYRFDGSLAPQLNGNNVIYDSNGHPIFIPISGLERYRRTLRFTQLGRSPQEIRELGGGASQFTITNGEEAASVSQTSLNAFVQDEWRLRPNLTLGLGLRFESQSNINKNLNFAPRISFAWSKMHKANRSASGNKSEERVNFVLRGGIGFFYEAFGEDFTLRANRLNGINQRRYIVTDPAVLDLFPQIPSEALLNGFSNVPSIVRNDPNLRAPLSIQSTISFEKQLPLKLVLSSNYLNVRTINALRSRFIASSAGGTPGRTFQYESTGKYNQNQLSFTLLRRLSKLSFYATYSLNKVSSDTDGADFIPQGSSGYENDYGRASSDVRHSLYLGGWIRTFFDIDINPLIFYRSGVPFDITLGRDLNGDTILNDRPSFATDFNRPSVVFTSLGAFDSNPIPGQVIIPRNYGSSPSFFSANVNFSKSFSIGGDSNSQSSGESLRRPLYFTVSVQIENLLNRTNPYIPEGNLSSPLFGQSYFSAGAYGFGASSPGNRIIRPNISFYF